LRLVYFKDAVEWFCENVKKILSVEFIYSANKDLHEQVFENPTVAVLQLPGSLEFHFSVFVHENQQTYGGILSEGRVRASMSPSGECLMLITDNDAIKLNAFHAASIAAAKSQPPIICVDLTSEE
jgi:hypothetical protein